MKSRETICDFSLSRKFSESWKEEAKEINERRQRYFAIIKRNEEQRNLQFCILSEAVVCTERRANAAGDAYKIKR